MYHSNKRVLTDERVFWLVLVGYAFVVGLTTIINCCGGV